MKNMTTTTKRISSSIDDDDIIELDIREQLTDICPAYSHYAKATLAIAGTLGTVALVKTTEFFPWFWSSDTSPNNGLDNPHQLTSARETITFTDNSFRTQLRHAKRAFGGEFQINTYTTNWQSSPSVAALSTGDFVVMWQSIGQDGDSDGIYGQLFSNTSIPQGSEFQINTHTTGAQNYPSVIGISAGDFVVTWQSSGQDGDGYGIYGQRYSSTGASQGSEFQINTYTTSYQTKPSVAALSTGDFVVTWASNGQDGDGYGIYGQRFSNISVPQGSEFQINTYTTSSQMYLSVAGLSTGDFVVLWHSYGQDSDGLGIYGQRYSSAGVAQGGEFQINTYTTSEQYYSSVAALGAGDFVVIWTSDGQDGDGDGIYGQRFSNIGVPQGSEFQINTYTTLDQTYPSVASLSTGDFVVTWQSNGQDGASYGIYGQRFSNTGVPQGSEFQINTYTTSEQLYPSVAPLGTDGFVVTWASNGQDGSGYGIYGRIYYNNEAPALVNNALTINEGETVILSTSNLSATDIDNNASELTFTVSGVQYGQFEQVANAGIAIMSFTQQDIKDGAIQFVHNGSENKPSYQISVSDGALTAGPASGNVVFNTVNDASLLVNNALTIGEGETVILSVSNLRATDNDNNASELTFTVSGVQYGQFERVSNAGVAMTSFTQQDINDGAIQFVHDGSQNSPSYVVNVSDGVFSDSPQAANITFHKITPIPTFPEIINDQSIINAKPNVPVLIGANTFFNITNVNTTTLSFDTIEITHVDNSLKLKWLDTRAPITIVTIPDIKNNRTMEITFDGSKLNPTVISKTCKNGVCSEPMTTTLANAFNVNNANSEQIPDGLKVVLGVGAGVLVAGIVSIGVFATCRHNQKQKPKHEKTREMRTRHAQFGKNGFFSTEKNAMAYHNLDDLSQPVLNKKEWRKNTIYEL